MFKSTTGCILTAIIVLAIIEVGIFCGPKWLNPQETPEYTIPETIEITGDLCIIILKDGVYEKVSLKFIKDSNFSGETHFGFFGTADSIEYFCMLPERMQDPKYHRFLNEQAEKNGYLLIGEECEGTGIVIKERENVRVLQLKGLWDIVSPKYLQVKNHPGQREFHPLDLQDFQIEESNTMPETLKILSPEEMKVNGGGRLHFLCEDEEGNKYDLTIQREFWSRYHK